MRSISPKYPSPHPFFLQLNGVVGISLTGIGALETISGGRLTGAGAGTQWGRCSKSNTTWCCPRSVRWIRPKRETTSLQKSSFCATSSLILKWTTHHRPVLFIQSGKEGSSVGANQRFLCARLRRKMDQSTDNDSRRLTRSSKKAAVNSSRLSSWSKSAFSSSRSSTVLTHQLRLVILHL